MERLAEIQARLDAATPGEWVRINTGVGVVLPGSTCQFVTRETTVRDATFIANAPTDIAYLLERVRKLEADVKNWEIWANHLPSREDYE